MSRALDAPYPTVEVEEEAPHRVWGRVVWETGSNAGACGSVKECAAAAEAVRVAEPRGAWRCVYVQQPRRCECFFVSRRFEVRDFFRLSCAEFGRALSHD